MAGWPWPLDSVQYWFEDLWKGFTTWITDGFGYLSRAITDFFGDTWAKITLGFSIMGGKISSFFGDFWARVSLGFSIMGGNISDFFGDSWGKISGAFSGLKASLTDFFGDAWTKISKGFSLMGDSISDFFGDAWTKISRGFSEIGTSLSAFFGDVWTKVSVGLSDLGTSLVNSLTLAVGTLAGYVQDAITGVLETVGAAVTNALSWIWTQLQVIAEAIMGGIAAIRDAATPFFQSILSGVTGTITEAFSGDTLPKEVQEASDKLAENLQKSLKRMMPKPSKSLPPFEEVQRSALITMATFTGANILGHVAGIAIDLIHPIKPIGVQVAIQGIIRSVSENIVTAPLITIPLETGVYRPLRYYYNEMNANMIPGPMDLITFVVREVIKLEVFVKNMGYHGFDKFFAMAYWEAHWVLPSFGNLREAMWRGFITPANFLSYVVLHDYKPTPREGIELSDQEIMMKLSYELPGRIQSRWMFEQGVIEIEEHRELTAQRGMDPAWVDRVVEAEERAAVRTEIEAAVRRWSGLMVEGFITPGQLKDVIMELGLGEKLADFWVQRSLAEQMSKYLIEEKNAIISNYERDAISLSEATDQLGELGVMGEVLETELRISTIKRIGRAA